MIEHKYFDLFWQGSVDKQWKIEYDSGFITNSDLFSQSIEISESLCSETELRFGSCEASSLKFKVANIVKPLINEWLTVSVVLNHQEKDTMIIGRYKVVSDKPTSDRRHREIIAYDAMYDIINADVAEWYNTLAFPINLNTFRNLFLAHFGISWSAKDGELVNDNMIVEKTIEPEHLSGKDVINAICEINGCFGHIGRDGKFQYIYLHQAIEGLYPSDTLFPDHAPEWMAQAKTGHLYPQDPKSTRVGNGTYISCHYEDYRTKPITKLQIRQEENDIGKIFPEGDIETKDNCYIIQDNFLVYGKSSAELTIIAQNIYRKITDIIYRPFDAECVGNPCLEVGEPVRFSTKYDIVESYILQRTLKGIQALRDNYQTNGVEKYIEEVNGVHNSIIQLNGRANILTRTLEETKLEMYDIADGLSNTITITEKDIRAELKNTAESLTNTINITAGEIRAELSDTESELSNTISVTAAQIRTELKNAKDGLESEITQTAGQIRTEVSNINQNLQSQITQNAAEIDLRVTKDGVVSAINLSPESVTIKAGKIDLQGLVNADELVSKFATITTLNATTAELNNLIAQKATISQLDASNARIGSLEVDHVSISDFNSINARIDNLSATKIDASTVKADYMEVSNWTSAGKIKADRIDADTIVAKIGSYEDRVNIHNILTTNIVVYDQLFVGSLKISTSASWQTITVGGKSYTVLCQ